MRPSLLRVLALLLAVSGLAVLPPATAAPAAPAAAAPSATDYDSWVAVPTEIRVKEFRKVTYDPEGVPTYSCIWAEFAYFDYAAWGIERDDVQELLWASNTPGRSVSLFSDGPTAWFSRIYGGEVIADPQYGDHTGWTPATQTFGPTGLGGIVALHRSPTDNHDDPGCHGDHVEDTQSGTLKIDPRAGHDPVPDFQWTIGDQRKVTFHNFTTNPHNDDLRYQWTFGDGGSSTEKSPVHQFAVVEDTYDVELSVLGPGVYESVTKTIDFTAARDLQVTLTPYDAEGDTITGMLAPGEEFFVEARLENTGVKTLQNFTFDGGELMSVDTRSPGHVVVLGQDQQVSSSGLLLAPGEVVTVNYRLTADTEGLAALNAKVSATNSSGDLKQDAESLRVDVFDGHLVDDAVGRWVLLQTVDRYLMSMYHDWIDALDKRAQKLKKALGRHLDKAEQAIYFGAKKGLQVTGYEQMRALLRNMSDNSVAASLPNEPVKGHTVEELNAAYDNSFKEEVGKGVKEWVDHWGKVGAKGKRAATAAYEESLLASFYFLGTATPEERMEFEARMIDFADNNTTSKNNLINTIKREIPRWKENGVYLGQAMKMSAKDVTLQSPDLQAQLKQERTWRANMLKNADKDPVRFQREWAKRDAEIFNLGMPIVLDTLIGGGVAKVGAVRIAGEGRAVLAAGESAGVVNAEGKVVKGATTAITPAETPTSMTGGAAARTTEDFLSNIDGATMVRASDYGNVYELPNLGGVPETTLDAKAQILGELQNEYATVRPGARPVKLVEVLKPGSPLRKPGGIAKLELTSPKTGKPEFLDAGAPDATLTEASVWHNTTPPNKLPGWKNLPKARQATAMKEWKKANELWAEWLNPDPKSKNARLQQCIGQEATVPLDLEPNPAGIQRFVTAEFEVVEVTQGTAEAKLIRVKSYKVSAVDTKTGRTVNSRTVVDSDGALPQTPDADAVALAKEELDSAGNPVLDAEGRPMVEPLSRSEREFFMQRYIDKNIKARRSGAIPDAAEHGVTLVMDDASALAAGELLPRYGVPFLPEAAGTAYLRRIAEFVRPKGPNGLSAEQMFQKMLSIVESEGGFGQHAVVLTSDSRYLGEIPVSSW